MMHFTGHGSYEVAVQQHPNPELLDGYYHPAKVHVRFNLQDGEQMELFGKLTPTQDKLLTPDHANPRDLLRMIKTMECQAEYEAVLTLRIFDLEKENFLLREHLSRAGKEVDTPIILQEKK